MNRDISLNIGPYLVPLLVIGLVALRLIRNKPRKVKPNRLLILPVFLALATAFTLGQTPTPGLLWIGIYVVAAVKSRKAVENTRPASVQPITLAAGCGFMGGAA